MKIIVACCKNMGIGYKNKIPWYLPPDLKFFKKLTSKDKNSAIVMGKNTWESLSIKPLPNRHNLILSKTLNNNDISHCKDTLVFNNKKLLMDHLTEKKYPTWIIGGESVYNDFIKEPSLREIYLTTIMKDYKVDTYFPNVPVKFYLEYKTCVKKYGNIYYTFSKYSKM